MFSINYGKEEKEYLERKLLDLPCSKVVDAKLGGIIEAVISYDSDSIDNGKSLSQLKKEYSDSTDEIDYVHSLIKDTNSKYNKQLDEYKKLLENYNKLPEFVKHIFSVDEILTAKLDRFSDIDENINSNIADYDYYRIEDIIFTNSDIRSIIRSYGMDGPDDEAIVSVNKKYDGIDDLIICGSFRFCVYGDMKNFVKLWRELSSYSHDNLQITEAAPAADTFGISMDAINNTDDTKWIRAIYKITYKI